ncbi:MAG: type IV toxin-antitoxin system AbiEi family antitoxin domain-containing protein, partial [Marmoricola sp.]
MDALRKICARYVVFLRREAIALGYDDRALALSVRRGVIHRVRRG